MERGMYTGKFNWCKNAFGFIVEHEYAFTIDKDRYGYIIIGIEDITTGEPCDGYMTCSSEKSIYLYFDIKEGDKEVDKS